MEDYIRIINSIIQANQQDNLVLFIGAGLSKCAGESFKTWSQIIEQLKIDLNISQETEFSRIAQMYYETFGKSKYLARIRQMIPEVSSSTAVHRMIMQLYPRTIITTNWDCLIEIASDERNRIYNCIADDNELAQSTIPHKIIKMHGDFKHKNIVFKEHDYIHYSQNFPLIENYIKSLLATNTILFVGYSYNDSDLIQIIDWINKCHCKTKMYMAFDKSTNEVLLRYVRSYGITPFFYPYKGEKINDVCYNNLPDDFSRNDYRLFLQLATNGEFDFFTYNGNPIHYVWEKLKALDQLSAILFKQIKNIIKKSIIRNDEFANPVLCYCEALCCVPSLSYHNRIIKQFFHQCIVEKQNSGELDRIFRIFRKAGFVKIGIVKSYSDDLTIVRCLSSKTQCYYDYYSDCRSKLLDHLINSCTPEYLLNRMHYFYRKKQFLTYYISCFNRTFLMKSYPYCLNDSFSSETQMDYKEWFSSLPKEFQNYTQAIYDVLSPEGIYNMNNIWNEIVSKQSQLLEKKNTGSIILYNDINRYLTCYTNILRFIIMNQILIGSVKEFKQLNYAALKSLICIQLLQDKIVVFNRYHIIAAIAYLDPKALEGLFLDNYHSSQIRFSISEKNKKWMIETILKLLLNQCRLKESSPGNSLFQDKIKNTLFLLKQAGLSPIYKKIIEDIFDANKDIYPDFYSTTGFEISQGNETSSNRKKFHE